MVPIKILIKNFLSYGPQIQEIDFSIYNLICLSGKNGHGKSALLDAITWSIWGHARKIGSQAKSDEYLVRLGQSSMMVSIDILSNNTLYRIKREFELLPGSKNSRLTLEFGIVFPDTQKVKHLTEKTIRDTQESINKVLGISYDIFINTAFLRQSNANEFSKKSPKERKEILAQILNLHVFEVLKKNAYEQARKFGLLTEQYLYQKNLIEKEVEEIGYYKTTQELLEHELEHIAIEQTNRKKSLNLLQESLEKSNYRVLAADALEKKIFDFTQTAAKLNQDIVDSFNQWRAAHRKNLIQSRHTLEDFKEAKKIETALKDDFLNIEHTYTTQKTLYTELTNNLKIYTLEMQASIVHITQERTNIENNILTCKNNIQSCAHEIAELEKKSIILKKSIADCLALQEQHKKFAQTVQKRTMYLSGWKAKLIHLKNEYWHIHGTIKTMRSSEQLPICPLCAEHIEEKKYTELLKKLNAKLQHVHKNIIRLKKAVEVVEEYLIKDENTHYVLNKADQEYTICSTNLEHITARLVLLQASHAELIRQKQELLILKKKLAEKQKELTEEQSAYTKKHKAALDLKAQELVCLEKTYKEHPYQSYRIKNVSALEEYENLLHYHEKNTREQQALWLKFLSEKNTLRALKIAYIKTQKEYALYEGDKQENMLLREQYALCQKKLQDLQVIKETLLQDYTKAKEQHIRLQSMQKQLIDIASHLKKNKQEEDDYLSLAHIFSKDGIQAMLIEEALPEIEYEANQLLSRLTYNQSHIIIDSLKDLKKGGFKETLDIKISDSLGIRPYELFSGGEAFKIDFSLRIAISKLLAKRAGTALQTLIIDEGFGSQDDDSLSLMMDTLHKIQADFEKIIIVSHLSFLKEQFPVHFIIQKTSQGSTVTVIQH